jgi:hypothetical protein
MVAGEQSMGAAMLKSRWLIVAAITLASQAAEAQQSALTLACKGTMTSALDEKPQPVSMGIIVNFTTRTVAGFGSPGALDYPVKITGVDDVTVMFGGSARFGDVENSIGSIDRVTGDVEATTTIANVKSDNASHTGYTLKCRPAQRMF